MNNVLLTESEIGYAAGFFDGEGSIIISMTSKANGRPYYNLNCSISQRVVWPLNKFKEWFGGSVKVNKTPRGKVNYRWTIVSQQAEDFLNIIKQHCIVKSSEIDIALDFRKTVQEQTARNKLGQVPPLTSEIVRLRNEYAVRLIECREKKYA